MSTATDYQDPLVSPRIRIAALWASVLFIYVYVDLFSLYRDDIRADIEAGKMSAFTIGQGFLLGVTLYIALPSLMVSLSLVLPVKLTRIANIILAALYAVTVLGGVVGESNYYYIVGSLAEVALLAGVAYYAWTWPRATDAAAAGSSHRSVATPAPSSSGGRR